MPESTRDQTVGQTEHRSSLFGFFALTLHARVGGGTELIPFHLLHLAYLPR
jgi:hypothetical protein